MIEIPLTQGYTAIVDDQDGHLSRFKWYAQRDACKGLVYARRWDGVMDGKQVPVRLHRAVLGAECVGAIVDHINGNGLDCRRENLRVVTAQQNARNLGGPRSSNKTSKYLGVTKRHGKYRARIMVGGKLVQIGTFETAEAANEARLAYELSAWGCVSRRHAR